MKKKIKIYGAIAIGVFFVVYAIYSALQPMAVETSTLVLEESEVSFIESGVVVNSGEKQIFPMASGEVDEILVKEGDVVKAGDVLASLDKSAIDYQVIQLEKMVEGYAAQLASAEVEHANAMDSLRASKSTLEGQLKSLSAQSGSSTSRELEQLLVNQSKTIYDRGLEDLLKNKELFDLGFISESEYNSFESLVDTYKANYDTATIALNAGTSSYNGNRSGLVAQIESVDAALERDTLTNTKAYYQAMLDSAEASYNASKVQAGYFDITSSIDGVVNEIMIENVNMVTGMTRAFIIQGSGDNKIEVKVNTRDINVITMGDKVELILDRRTGDVVIDGTISYVATSASVELSPLGVEERKVQVIIDPSDDTDLGSGFDVDVRFIVYNESNKLIVQNSALYTKDEKDMVMVIRSGVAKGVEVTLGYELTGKTIIDEGLLEGDVVITDLDAKGLKVGSRVKSSSE